MTHEHQLSGHFSRGFAAAIKYLLTVWSLPARERLALPSIFSMDSLYAIRKFALSGFGGLQLGLACVDKEGLCLWEFSYSSVSQDIAVSAADW